jgi:hypothetical protein
MAFAFGSQARLPVGPSRGFKLKAWTNDATYTPKSQQIVPTGERFGSDWFVWSMTYAQGKSIPVHAAYQQQLDPGFLVGWTPASYVLRTGALWNGSIGRAAITMAFDRGAVLSGEPAPQQQEEGKLTWTFEYFKPTQDINTTYVDADFWTKLQAARSTASAPGPRPGTWSQVPTPCSTFR